MEFAAEIMTNTLRASKRFRPLSVLAHRINCLISTDPVA